MTKFQNKIAAQWKLSDLKPVMHNYVLSGFQGGQPIILKLSDDIQGLKQEARALEAFAGYGAVRVLAQQDGALLLERAVSGISLKSYFPHKDHEAIQIACDAMQKLHQAPLPTEFPNIRDWLAGLDKDWDIPLGYLEKARYLRDQLLQTSAKPVLLHGDLHHDNILQNGSGWLVIDPKGVVGEPAYEVAAFIRNPMPELLDQPDAASIIKQRISAFARILDLDPARIKNWCFVQAILSWVWALEDGIDVEYFERFAMVLD